MRFRSTAMLSGLVLTALTMSASADVLVTVDKSSQQMTVTVDGQPRYNWPVSTGVPGYDTPGGTYKPFRMEANHFSREWDNAPMPHSIFFSKVGHAIHGTTHVKNLGRAASHGCVRLAPGNAATLFALVKQQGMANTRVVLDGSVSDAVAARGESRGRGGRSPQSYDDGGVVPAGMQTGRERAARYRYEPQPRQEYRQEYRAPVGGFFGQGFYDY